MPFLIDGSNGNQFSTWTTATRPTSPQTGQVGYNTTTFQLEVYNSTYNSWINVNQPGSSYATSYLVVAGGGGGGGNWGGAGGVGGYLTGTANLVIGSVYTITIGADVVTVGEPVTVAV